MLREISSSDLVLPLPNGVSTLSQTAATSMTIVEATLFPDSLLYPSLYLSFSFFGQSVFLPFLPFDRLHLSATVFTKPDFFGEKTNTSSLRSLFPTLALIEPCLISKSPFNISENNEYNMDCAKKIGDLRSAMERKASLGGRVEWRARFHSVFVGNVHRETTLGTLWKIFSEYGVVADVYLPNRKQGFESRVQSKFAFVRYRNLEEAEKAMIEGDRRCIDSRFITVRKALNSRRLNVESGRMVFNQGLYPDYSNMFEKWFSSVTPWMEDKVERQHHVWIRLEDVPLILWHEEFFSKIVGDWGRVLQIADITRTRNSLVATWLLVEVDNKADIPRTSHGKASEVSFNILVSVTSSEAVPKMVPEFIRESSSESSSAASHRTVDFSSNEVDNSDACYDVVNDAAVKQLNIERSLENVSISNSCLGNKITSPIQDPAGETVIGKSVEKIIISENHNSAPANVVD
ncbi:hypothetical protein COLO4_36434 [Corchorus olitorius]|uniref:RRM domain-containing protein n=1 Tax=Corchorus olitorius TaxID=93759 RepID=A0A1R3G936_9ROSI|nr:hypothetical protein COLO4_36434 [Corchorus olitorius]